MDLVGWILYYFNSIDTLTDALKDMWGFGSFVTACVTVWTGICIVRLIMEVAG